MAPTTGVFTSSEEAVCGCVAAECLPESDLGSTLVAVAALACAFLLSKAAVFASTASLVMLAAAACRGAWNFGASPSPTIQSSPSRDQRPRLYRKGTAFLSRASLFAAGGACTANRAPIELRSVLSPVLKSDQSRLFSSYFSSPPKLPMTFWSFSGTTSRAPRPARG